MVAALDLLSLVLPSRSMAPRAPQVSDLHVSRGHFVINFCRRQSVTKRMPRSLFSPTTFCLVSDFENQWIEQKKIGPLD
jgi:hypothetical protein